LYLRMAWMLIMAWTLWLPQSLPASKSSGITQSWPFAYEAIEADAQREKIVNPGNEAGLEFQPRPNMVWHRFTIATVDGNKIYRLIDADHPAWTLPIDGFDNPWNGASISNAELRPGSWVLWIPHCDPRKSIRVPIETWGVDFVQVPDLRHFIVERMIKDLSELVARQGWIIDAVGITSPERILQWPNAKVLEQGTIAEAEAGNIKIAGRRWTQNQFANLDVMYIDANGQEQRGRISRNDEQGSVFFSAAPGTAGGVPKIGETAYIIVTDGLFQWERIARGLADQEMPGRVRSWYRGPTEPFYTHTPDVLLKEEELDAVMVGMPLLEIRRLTGAAGACNEQPFTVFDKDHWSAADEECSKADKCYTPDSPKAWIRWCQVRQDDRWGKFVHPKFLNSLLSGGTLEVRPSPFSVAEGQQAAGCDSWTSVTGTHIGDTGISVPLSLPPEFEPGDFVNFAIKAANGTTLAEGQSSYANGVLAGDFDDTVPLSDPLEYIYENKQIIITAGRTRKYPAEFLFLKAVTIFVPDIDPDPLVIPAGSKVVYPPREPDPLASDPTAGPGRWVTYPASTHYAFRTGLGFLSEGDKPRDQFVEGHRARFVAQTRRGPGIFAPQQFIKPLASGAINPQAIYYDKAYQGRHTPETEKFLDAMLKGTVTTFTTRSITDATKNWWRDNWYEGGTIITHEGTATGGSNLTLRDATKAGLGLFDPSRGRFKQFVLEVEETPGSEKWHKRPIIDSAVDSGGFSCTVLYSFPFSTSGKHWRIREPKFILNLHKDEPVKLTWADGHSEDLIAQYSDDDTLWLPAATRPFEMGMSYQILKRKTGPYVRSGGKWAPDTSGLMPTVLKRYGYFMLGDIVTAQLFKELKLADDYQVDTIGDFGWTSRLDPNVPELNHRQNFRNPGGPSFDNAENDFSADYVYDEFDLLTPGDPSDGTPPGNPIEGGYSGSTSWGTFSIGSTPMCAFATHSNSLTWGNTNASVVARVYGYGICTIPTGGICPISSKTYYCVKVVAPFTDQSPTPINPDIIVPTPCGYIHDTFDEDGNHTNEQRWDFDANGDPVQCGGFSLFSSANFDIGTGPAMVDRRSARLGSNVALPNRPTAIVNLGSLTVISGDSAQGWEAVAWFQITRWDFKQLDASILGG
jgi:hypothetical protein